MSGPVSLRRPVSLRPPSPPSRGLLVWAESARAHFAVLLVSYALARYELLGRLDSPVFGWRPADGAGIALNYLRNGFRFFFPQVLWGTSGNGYVEMEFPLAPYLTALLMKVFGAHEYVNLFVPLACGFGIVWVTYSWGRRFIDPLVGLVAAWLVAVTPVLIMLTDTGLWADPPMVLFATLGLYLIARWEQEQRTSLLVWGAASVALAILLKLTGLYVGIPIAYLFCKRYGASVYKSRAVWLTGFGMLVPSLLWYWHAHQLFVEYKNTFGIVGSGYSKFGSLELLASASFYKELARRVTLYHLTPLFTFGFAFGLHRLWRRREWLMLSWLASIVVYVAVTAYGVNGGHYHYLLPFLPLGALVGASGVISVMHKVGLGLRTKSEWLWRGAAAAACLVFALTAGAAERRFESRDRAPENASWMKKKRTGQRIKALTKPHTLLIVVDSHMDKRSIENSMTPPDVFYFSDRRGWYLSSAWLSIPRIEELHARGATVLVVSGQSVDDFKEQRKDMVEYLSSRYHRIMDDEDGIAFELGRPSQQAQEALWNKLVGESNKPVGALIPPQ